MRLDWARHLPSTRRERAGKSWVSLLVRVGDNDGELTWAEPPIARILARSWFLWSFSKRRSRCRVREIEIPKKDKVKAGGKNWFRWTSRKWNEDAPSALTHISTGVVYASPGVVKMPPCVLDTRTTLSAHGPRD